MRTFVRETMIRYEIHTFTSEEGATGPLKKDAIDTVSRILGRDVMPNYYQVWGDETYATVVLKFCTVQDLEQLRARTEQESLCPPHHSEFPAAWKPVPP